MDPGLRVFAEDVRVPCGRFLAYVGALAVLAVTAAHLFFTPHSAAALASRPDWTEVGRPLPAFALAFPEIVETEARYVVRRHAAGGGRKDILSFGQTSGSEPNALIEIYRAGKEGAVFADASQDIATRAADHGPVGLLGAIPGPDSKFGPVDLVDFTIGTGATGQAGGVRRCLGFARHADEPRLHVVGWYCNAGPKIVDRAIVACALDRLTLQSAAGEPRLQAFFARAERERTLCGVKGTHVAATRKRGDWIDALADPKLRGRFAGR